ncbi:hypothetical protein KR009_009392 [Drosophila setifemur]|nr:hypothetical protein KR009_009392 [Drosophila setifemur]
MGISKTMVFFIFTTVIVLICLVIIAMYCGFNHEPKKFKYMVVTVVIVLLLQAIIFDLIKFAVLAIDYATWPQEDAAYTVDGTSRFDYIVYLKIRLLSLRSELLITDEHRNEQLNMKYSRIARELFLYGSYFFLLLMVVLVGQDQILYHNTHAMERLFHHNTSQTIGLNNVNFLRKVRRAEHLEMAMISMVESIPQIYTFLNITMVDAFFVNPKTYKHDGWWAIEQNQRMGVVRLRQMRVKDCHYGLGRPNWENMTFQPEWKLPYHRMHYSRKYWRIYDPFRPMRHTPSFMDGLLLNFKHNGHITDYPELAGYCTYLMSTKINCIKVIEFLSSNSWLDSRTKVLFIDFTLFNADANVFTRITMRIEITPFGTLLTNTDVDSVRMLEHLDQKSALELCVFIFYLVLVVQFTRRLLTKVWYSPKCIAEAWNIVDMIICLLNLLLMILFVVREVENEALIERIELATQAQYLKFQRPIRIHLLIAVVKGFLIGITTLRLWKVLQFATVFQHFTRTLSSAWQAVASLGVIIVILLMAIGIALAVPNGNNAELFQHLVKATTTCLWYYDFRYTMGFNSNIKPSEFFHGGLYIGLLFYLVLVFLVAILMINVFASVIFQYFNTTGRILKEQHYRRISFFQFLRVEYADFFHRLRWLRCLRSKYHRDGKSVHENVEASLKRLEEKNRVWDEPSRRYIQQVNLMEPEDHQEDYHRRVERLFKIQAILIVQIEMLERMLLGDEYGNLPPETDSDSDPEEMPEMYRRRPKTPK